MTDIEAALVTTQLKKLPGMIKKRLHLAEKYTEMLRDLPEIQLPLNKIDRVWYRYVIRTENEQAEDFINYCVDRGVNVVKPVHPWLSNDLSKNNPVALRAYGTLVSLPLYPTLKTNEQTIVVETVRSHFSKA